MECLYSYFFFVSPSLRANVRYRFLLAQLYVEILSKKQDRRSVRRALEALPTSLDDTYNQALGRIRSQDADDAMLAQKILYWISFAVRPLTTTGMSPFLSLHRQKDQEAPLQLTPLQPECLYPVIMNNTDMVAELICAIAAGYLDPDENYLDNEAFVDRDVLIDVCAGIVTVDRESTIIRLVHYSTQQYFERNRTAIFPDAQSHISRVCLRYLSLEAFFVPCTGIVELSDRIAQNTLFDYAAKNWGYHAKNSPEQEVLKEIYAFFQLGSHLRSSVQCCLWEIGDPHFFGLKPQDLGLWLAIKFGLLETVKTLLSEGAFVNVYITEAWSRTSALRIAVAEGHEGIVSCLLESGATTNEDPGPQSSLLGLAAEKGSFSIVQLLLNSGINIHAEDQLNGTALLAIINRRGLSSSATICQLLVDRGVNLEFWEEPHGTALGNLVAEYPTNRPEMRLAIIRILLQAGANVEAKNSKGESPLIVSGLLGGHEMVKILIKAGASLTKQDWLGFAALHSAPPDETLVGILIANGADVNALARSGETPLHYAAAVGDSASAKLLLHHGANLNALTLEGYTPLDKALMHGRSKFVEWRISLDDIMPNTQALWAQQSNKRPQPFEVGESQLHIKEQLCLQDHVGEPWNAIFSNSGDHLATFGEDGSINLYETDRFSLLRIMIDDGDGKKADPTFDTKSLNYPPYACKSASWSSDDSKIIACYTDKVVRLWDTAVCSLSFTLFMILLLLTLI